jgi:hypothetical protein
MVGCRIGYAAWATEVRRDVSHAYADHTVWDALILHVYVCDPLAFGGSIVTRKSPVLRRETFGSSSGILCSSGKQTSCYSQIGIALIVIRDQVIGT